MSHALHIRFALAVTTQWLKSAQYNTVLPRFVSLGCVRVDLNRSAAQIARDEYKSATLDLHDHVVRSEQSCWTFPRSQRRRFQQNTGRRDGRQFRSTEIRGNVQSIIVETLRGHCRVVIFLRRTVHLHHTAVHPHALHLIVTPSETRLLCSTFNRTPAIDSHFQ